MIITVVVLCHTNACEACSRNAVNYGTVARWFKWFQEGRRSTKDDVRTSHSSIAIDNTSIAIMSMLLDKGRRMTVLEMEGWGIPKTTIHHILTKYMMKKKRYHVCCFPSKNNDSNYVRNIWFITKRKELCFCNE